MYIGRNMLPHGHSHSCLGHNSLRACKESKAETRSHCSKQTRGKLPCPACLLAPLTPLGEQGCCDWTLHNRKEAWKDRHRRDIYPSSEIPTAHYLHTKPKLKKLGIHCSATTFHWRNCQTSSVCGKPSVVQKSALYWLLQTRQMFPFRVSGYQHRLWPNIISVLVFI